MAEGPVCLDGGQVARHERMPGAVHRLGPTAAVVVGELRQYASQRPLQADPLAVVVQLAGPGSGDPHAVRVVQGRKGREIAHHDDALSRRQRRVRAVGERKGDAVRQFNRGNDERTGPDVDQFDELVT